MLSIIPLLVKKTTNKKQWAYDLATKSIQIFDNIVSLIVLNDKIHFARVITLLPDDGD